MVAVRAWRQVATATPVGGVEAGSGGERIKEAAPVGLLKRVVDGELPQRRSL